MTKYVLIMIMCSLSTGDCLPPHEIPKQFETIYDCLNAGYIESLNKSQEIGKEDVNQYGIYVKFVCTAKQVV
tara:strand:+ start:1331 stop:1546 length:216 start_codon:yes stop_codon:yes gene_type:complete